MCVKLDGACLYTVLHRCLLTILDDASKRLPPAFH
jgi:hypothetical protein